MTTSDAAAETQRRKIELRDILESPLDESGSIHMTVKELRWLLRWHGDLVRLLTLIEVERNEAPPEGSTPARKEKAWRVLPGGAAGKTQDSSKTDRADVPALVLVARGNEKTAPETAASDPSSVSS